MKKYFIMAALAVAATFSFTACGDDDNNGSKSSDIPTDLKVPDMLDDTGSFKGDPNSKPDFDQLVQFLTENGVDGGLVTLVPLMIDFGTDGQGLMELFDEFVGASGKGKSVGMEDALSAISSILSTEAGPRKIEVSKKLDFQYVEFNYSYKNGKYIIPNFADFEFQGNNALVYFKGLTSSRIIDGVFSKGSIAAGDMTNYLCREWAINKVMIEATKSGSKTTVGGTFNTTNLIQIANELEDKHDIVISENDRNTLSALGALERIRFSNNGRLTFFFTNKIYTGTWAWKGNMNKGQITYKFEKSDMKNPLFPNEGEAVATIKLSNKTLQINAKYTNDKKESYKINTILYISPYFKKR